MKSIKSFIGIALIGLMLATALPAHASPTKHNAIVKTEQVCHLEKSFVLNVNVSPAIVCFNVPASEIGVFAEPPVGLTAVKLTAQTAIILYKRTLLNDARPPNLSCRVDNRRSYQVHPQLLQIQI